MSAKSRARKRDALASLTEAELLDYLRHAQPISKRDADSISTRHRILEGSLWARAILNAIPELEQVGYWQSDTQTLKKAEASAKRYLDAVDLLKDSNKVKPSLLESVLGILQEPEIQRLIQSRDDALVRGFKAQTDALLAEIQSRN